MTRVGIVSVLLLALVLSSSVPVAGASHSGSLEEELARLVNSTQAAQWILSEGLVDTNYARQVFDRLAACSKDSRLAFIAQSLEGATVSASQGLILDMSLWRRNGRALITLIMENPGAVSGCDSQTIYEAVLLALGQPTPLGILLPSRGLLADIGAYIASNIVSRAVPEEPRLAGEAALIASRDPVAGYALLALYGRAGQGFWERVLGNASTASALCLVFSFASPDSIPEPVAKKALAMITGPYYVLGPAAEVWLASRLYGARGAVFCFVAVTRLLDAAYPGYVSMLTRLPMYRVERLETRIPVINGSMDALQVLMASSVWNSTVPSEARLAAITRINRSIVYSPSALAAIITRLYRYKPTPVINETNRSLACRLAETMITRLLNSSQPPSQLAWDVAASATSLCALETGDIGAVERLLLYQPFASTDPWALGLAAATHTEPGTRLHAYAQQLAETLWSNNPWRVLETRPPGSDEAARTLYNLVAAGLEAWREGLRPGVLLGNTTGATSVATSAPAPPLWNVSVAEDLLEKLAQGGGLAGVLDTVATNMTGGLGAVTTQSPLGQGVSTGNVSEALERIGLVARMLSVRPLGNDTSVLDVASTRALSSLLASQAGVVRESMDKVAEIVIGGANASELLTSIAPREGVGTEQSGSLGAMVSWSLGLNPSPEPPVTITTSKTGTTSAESLANQVEELARSISGTGYGAALREALTEIAKALRSNDYAAAAMYTEKLRELTSLLPANKPGETTPIGAGSPEYSNTRLGTEPGLISNRVNAEQLLDELTEITQSATAISPSSTGYTSTMWNNIGALGELGIPTTGPVASEENSAAGAQAQQTIPVMPGENTRGGGEETIPGQGIAPSQASFPQRVSQNKLLQELQDALEKHDTRKAATLLEKIAASNNEALKAKALQLLNKEDSETLSELVKEITKQARQGEISGKEAKLLSNLLGKLPVKGLEAKGNNEINLPRISMPSGGAPGIHPPRVSPPSISPPSMGAGGAGLQWLLLALAIGLVAALLARGLSGITITMHKSRIRKLRKRIAEAKKGKSGEQAKTLRDLVIALYAETLKLYSKLYRPKAPSETHREYAHVLPPTERHVYEPVASVYEKAKFSFNPVTTSDVELVERSLGELRRRAEEKEETRRKR